MHQILRVALTSLLAGLILCLPAVATPGPDSTVEELLDRIVDEGDKVDGNVFDQLARIGTDAAFEASVKAIKAVKKEPKLNRAYKALALYSGQSQVDRALALLSKDAHRHQRAFNRRAATRGLVAFGERAEGPLLELVRTHKDDEVRRLAIWTALEPLAASGDPASLELVLEWANPSVSNRHGQLTQALAGFGADDVVARMLEVMVDQRAHRDWRELMLERFAEEPGRAIDQALVELVEGKDLHLGLLAVECLGERGTTQAEAAIRKHLKSKDGPMLRAAIVALSQLVDEREPWREEVTALARDRRPAARMGAAVALTELRTGPDLELLYELAKDTNQAVRLTALREVASLRRPDGVGLLIERLGVETGTVELQIAMMLRLMTGEDHGASARWKLWWKAEGETFELPDYDTALMREHRREARREEGGTQASFYGLRIISDRVCFVLDTSGSMAAAANLPGERSTTKGKSASTRIEVAKYKLAEALTSFADEDLFNIVFFDTDVSPFTDELIEMTAKARAAALKYVSKQVPGGGTAVYDALDAAFDDERVDTIFLLTDGAPSAGRIVDPDRIAEAIARRNSTRLVTIHCISIGQSSALLQRLARDSGGSYVEFR
ncbi:MAG: VWA domain-containing protein [Planctomycetota bacterium]|nr:VWA domain-containing protein [Planctomycetota bacterium]